MVEKTGNPWDGVISDKEASAALLPRLFSPLTSDEKQQLGSLAGYMEGQLPIVCAIAATRYARNHKMHDASSTMRLSQQIAEATGAQDVAAVFDTLNVFFGNRLSGIR